MRTSYRYMVFILVICVLFLSGCGKITDESANMNSEIMIYSDGWPKTSSISIETAMFNLKQKVFKESFKCVKVEVIEEKLYYVFCAQEDQFDRLVTVGWYAVEVYSGEVFYYNIGDQSLDNIR